MTPVTELATITMKDGVDIADPQTKAYQIWQDTLNTISRQDGFKHQRYGPTLENPSVVELAIDWESIESHNKFINSPAYAPFVAELGELRTALKIFHFQPYPSPPKILDDSASLIEMATFFKTDEMFNDRVGKFVEGVNRAEGSTGAAHGPILERISKDDGAEPGRAVMLCIGWVSWDAHMAFRESALFKENIHYLREGVEGVEMHHTKFTSFGN